MLRILLALIISIPIYGVVYSVSVGLVPVVMLLQILAGLDQELFD